MSGKSPRRPKSPGSPSGGKGNELWTRVDAYLDGIVAPTDAALDGALADAQRAGLPSIAVSPTQGKLLHILARAVHARRILEIGTLAGYSAIWMARALEPGGKLITLEFLEEHAAVARRNIERAGLGSVVDVRVGAALRTLPTLEAEKAGPFDLTFIDADKGNNAAYFDWAVKLSRPGAFVIVDNVIRDGHVLEATSTDKNIVGVRELHERLRAYPAASATTIQTVGAKGYDGLTIAIVNQPRAEGEG